MTVRWAGEQRLARPWLAGEGRLATRSISGHLQAEPAARAAARRLGNGGRMGEGGRSAASPGAVALAMVAGSAQGMVAVAADGTVLLANPAAEQLVGPLMVGRPLSALSRLGSVALLVEEFADGETPSDAAHSVELLEERRVLVAVSRLPGLREPAGFLLSLREDPDFEPAQHDRFTGLLNRRGLQDQLEMLAQHGGGVVASFDIDGLKLVNDAYGHRTGDAVIRQVATTLAATVPRPGIAARTGGDEFVVVLPGASRSEAVPTLARITEAVQQPVTGLPAGTGPLVVSVSVGMAELTAGRFPDHALMRADRALHVAKARGGGCVVPDGPEVQDWARDRSSLMSWLQQLREENDRLREQSRTDALTGLPNPWALQQAEDLLAEATYPVAVLFIDLDLFGDFNHRYGDAAGDAALTAVAAALGGGLRAQDQVFRKGGEEFVALLPGVDTATAAIAADRLRAAVQALGIPHADNPPHGVLTATIAVTTTSPGSHPEHARNSAADLVYAAKMAGRRNQVHP